MTDAPHRMFVRCSPNGAMGRWHDATSLPDTAAMTSDGSNPMAEYILATPAALSEHPAVQALLVEERALMMDALGALVSARDTIRRKWGTTNPERERVISALCKALDVDVVFPPP